MSFSVFSHQAVGDRSLGRLQIRSFTPDVYNAIKRREDWRSKRRRDNYRLSGVKTANFREANVSPGDSVPSAPFEFAFAASPPLEGNLSLPTFCANHIQESYEQPSISVGSIAHTEPGGFQPSENEVADLVDNTAYDFCTDTEMVTESETMAVLECEAEMPNFFDYTGQSPSNRLLATAESSDRTTPTTLVTGLSDCTSSTVANTVASDKIWSDLCSQSSNLSSLYFQSQTGFVPLTNASGSTQTHERWTEQQDELLLHLRDIAQLSWHTLAADYFPSLPTVSVKRRYRALQFRQGKSNVTQQCQSHVEPELRASSYNTPVRATGPKANGFGGVTLCPHALPEDTSRRTRSGRRIMKPLKYWAGECYVWKRGVVEGVLLASGAF